MKHYFFCTTLYPLHSTLYPLSLTATFGKSFLPFGEGMGDCGGFLVGGFRWVSKLKNLLADFAGG